MAEPQNKKPFIIGAVVLVVLIAAFLWHAHFAGQESTDDAFLDAHIIPISAKVAGQVLAVHVQDNQAVKAGDPLVEIDPRDYQAQLAQQRAKVMAAETEVRRAAADAKRYEEVYANEEISKQQLDNAQAAAASAQATLEKERAALQQDELNLSYTHITAPQAGLITKKAVEAGAYVQVGQTLLSIVPQDVWVTANFKETQLTHMRPGQKVTIKIDAYPDHKLDGHIDSIQSGTGERFSVLPSENATGNYVKVVQRVPVKIVIDTPADQTIRLAPGMSVVPIVFTKE
jgi:membrane fusion protein, multidrug efflux system